MELTLKLNPEQAQLLFDILAKAKGGYVKHLELLVTSVPEVIPYYQHQSNTLNDIQTILGIEMHHKGVLKKTNIELFSEFVESQTK